jgi:hypothetical protein
VAATRARARRRRLAPPFYVLDELVKEHGLRAIPDRLVDALRASASDYMHRAQKEPAAKATQEAAAFFALTAGAVRLWALSQDAVEGIPWPSVLSCALTRRDNLAKPVVVGETCSDLTAARPDQARRALCSSRGKRRRKW